MASKTPGDIIKSITTFKKNDGKFGFNIIYDSPTETLEPVYFWILDFMNQLFGGKVEKLVDNFAASPGSGHFGEMGQRATRMQEEAMKIYGLANTVIKSILNLIYDLREFQIRLKIYEKAASKDSNTSQGALLSLKQIWMDQVDIKKGRGSINMMSQDLSFTTLRDAFMYCDSVKSVEDKKLDLNERVKRILKARLEEFVEWRSKSELELKKRYEIEKTYLKTQVDTLKMYSRWAKPYLVAAQQLGMKDYARTKPDLVSVFSTMFLELTLFGIRSFDLVGAALNHQLPSNFKTIKLKRNYNSCVLVSFKFRGIPQRAGQNFVFGGRAEVSFNAYSLNDDELKLFKKKLEDSDIEEGLNLVQGMTDETLGQIKADIDEFLNEDKNKEKEKEDKEKNDINPFSALLNLKLFKDTFKIKEKKKTKEEEDKEEKAYVKKLEEKGIPSDSYNEKMLRDLAFKAAKSSCYTIYDIYKKAHGMASSPKEAYG
jgi:hypothetical protein